MLYKSSITLKVMLYITQLGCFRAAGMLSTGSKLCYIQQYSTLSCVIMHNCKSLSKTEIYVHHGDLVSKGRETKGASIFRLPFVFCVIFYMWLNIWK